MSNEQKGLIARVLLFLLVASVVFGWVIDHLRLKEERRAIARTDQQTALLVIKLTGLVHPGMSRFESALVLQAAGIKFGERLGAAET